MSLLSLSLSLLISVTALSAVRDDGPKTGYDSSTDTTTVSLAPLQVSGEKDDYLSLYVAASFKYAGHTFSTPENYRFEIRSVVKGSKLNPDLYIVFVIDGETIHLGSNRWALRNPVHGRRAIGEVIVMQMPRVVFLKLTAAKQAAIKMGGTTFEIAESQRANLRRLLQQTTPTVNSN